MYLENYRISSKMIDQQIRFGQWYVTARTDDTESLPVSLIGTNTLYIHTHTHTRCFADRLLFCRVSQRNGLYTKGVTKGESLTERRKTNCVGLPLRHNSHPVGIYLCTYIYAYTYIYRKRDYFLCSAIAIYTAFVNHSVGMCSESGLILIDSQREAHEHHCRKFVFPLPCMYLW